MLCHCPDLEDIALPQYAWDPESLPRVRWRHLRVLNMAVPPAQYAHQCAFLTAHPTITHLTIAGPTIHDAPDGVFALEGVPALVSFVGPFHHLEHIPRPQVIETPGIASPVAGVGFLRLVSALVSFPALTRLDLPLIFAPAAADVAALPTACPSLLFAPCVDPPPTAVAALAHALRAFAALRILALVKACAAPECAITSAAALLRRLPRVTTVRMRLLRADSARSSYTCAGSSDVYASERARGIFGGEFASADARADEDDDAPLQFVPPGDPDSAPHLVRPYGFVHGRGQLGRRRGREPSRRRSVRVRDSRGVA
ncbi:hypothetical protein FB451DRAFT_1556948 [Mycena latifolia]|nr:hypothetical protein FB451DRAFT_1556948 [Mycena latifolia]